MPFAMTPASLNLPPLRHASVKMSNRIGFDRRGLSWARAFAPAAPHGRHHLHLDQARRRATGDWRREPPLPVVERPSRDSGPRRELRQAQSALGLQLQGRSTPCGQIVTTRRALSELDSFHVATMPTVDSQSRARAWDARTLMFKR